MSGYGGGPPPGWQDPYGGSQGWSGDPYGGDPYGGAYGPGGAPGYGYGPPGVPTRPASNASTIAALVCNIAGVVLCCGILSIPGAITSAIAMSRVETDPDSARKLTIWSWVLFGLSVFIGIILMIVYIAVIVMSEDYSSTTTY
ncbi:hypothetical protein [Actinomadura sp. 7K507]|uniref:hypothetical protein n=1 Tax=Actinomadura sp. 7K507 TaxID=2530365 RepID=UPI00104F83E5|nr:hypothetical protein [Actinomadura sp. 7K507]TDC85467.1 hypothetical protein E1285_25085 [Actinomadura sp. 7K507]